MRVFKRILAGLVLLLGAVGLLLSLAGGVGVWVVKEPVTDCTTRVFGRIETALALANGGLGQAEVSLARAAERLDGAREEQRRLAQEPPQGGAARRLLVRTIEQRIAPEVGDAQQTLHTVAEAAVVVNSVLEDLGNLPVLSTSGLDADRLTEINSRLGNVGPAAWELSRLVREPGPDSDAATAQFSRIEQALTALRGLIADYKSQVAQARERTEALKSQTLARITPAAAIISFVCFWVALSQVSLLAHAWSWWRHLGHDRVGANVSQPTTGGG
jgi:hypothetical protein